MSTDHSDHPPAPDAPVNLPVPADTVDLFHEYRDVGVFVYFPDDPACEQWIGVHREDLVTLPFP